MRRYKWAGRQERHMRSGVQGPEISSFHENFPPLKGLYRQRELKGPGRGARLPACYVHTPYQGTGDGDGKNFLI